MTHADPALAGRIPPGQTRTTKWPVLTYGLTPPFDPTRWTFRCFGRVEREVAWTWKEFLTLPRATLTSDVHCVTRWSRLDNRWEGVAIRELMARVTVLPDAKYVMVHADPDYTTNLALADLVDDDVLLALRHDGRDLEPDHGGPCRLVVPKLYFWKSAKWVRGFEFLDVNPPGFWEQNGYHMHADPWTEERYSDKETRAMQTMPGDHRLSAHRRCHEDDWRGGLSRSRATALCAQARRVWRDPASGPMMSLWVTRKQPNRAD